jgi:hypothetical protein
LSAAFELGQRMITFLLYLTRDCEGGDTTFPKLGIVTRGQRGWKWIVAQFVRDIALRFRDPCRDKDITLTLILV